MFVVVRRGFGDRDHGRAKHAVMQVVPLFKFLNDGVGLVSLAVHLRHRFVHCRIKRLPYARNGCHPKARKNFESFF